MRNQTTIKITILLLCFCISSYAQQDPQYSQYMYNIQSINPAYAGTEDASSFLGLYRSQWVGLEGAPKTQILSFHSPFGNNVGLGINMTNDDIFIASSTYLAINFGYKLKVSSKSIISLGIKAGGKLVNINTTRLNNGAESEGDDNAMIYNQDNFTPQVGFGAYYYSEKFYLGFSIPGILDSKKFQRDSDNVSSYVSEKPHYYFMTGYSLELNKDILLKPAALIKIVEGAPIQLDVSTNFLLYNKLTLGAAYRWNSSVSAMAAFQITNKLLIGYAYEMETSELKRYSGNSSEIILRYNFIKKNKKAPDSQDNSNTAITFN